MDIQVSEGVCKHTGIVNEKYWLLDVCKVLCPLPQLSAFELVPPLCIVLYERPQECIELGTDCYEQ